MFKNVLKKMLILAGIGIGLLILMIGGVFLFTRQAARKSAPVVNIHSPKNGIEVSLGESLAVQSTSSDESQIITSVELWSAQEGVLTLINRETLGDEDHSISLTQGWQPSVLGTHRLIVRAFNDLGNSGQSAVDLLVVEHTEEAAFFLAEGEMLPPVGGFEPSLPAPEAGVEEEESAPSPPPPEPDPNPPNPPVLFPILFEILMETFIPADLNGTWVEVEAISFQVQEEYDELYCYVGLADFTPRRIPETGSFHVINTYEWNLPDYLGGNNKAIVLVPENEPLDLYLDCVGFKQGSSTPLWPGVYKTEHPPVDWTGEIIEGHSTEGDGFTISYRINPVGGPIPAPTNLHHTVWLGRTLLTWDWMGDESEIDGFKFYRGDNLVATELASQRRIEIPPWWIVPPCGDEYSYTVVAYKDDIPSPASNNLVYQSANCDGLDNIDERIINPICDGVGHTVDVLYQYHSMHGVASMDIRALKDGEVVPQIFSTRVQIQHGSGGANITMNNSGHVPIQTDQLNFYMYDHANIPFYVETIDHTINWGTDSPDLIIPRAWVDRPNSKLNIKVKNDSCGGFSADNPFLSFVREADGWSGFYQFEQDIRPGSQKLVTIDLDPNEMDLWAGEINITIDPLDDVEETDEDNNAYQIGEARIKRVVFTQSYIADDHDGLNDGEWDMYFSVCKAPCDIDTAPTIYESYHWGTGVHQINGVYFNPIIDSDDALIIHIRAVEYDKYWIIPSYEYVGSVKAYHSPDGEEIPALRNAGKTHMGSWKAGGTFTVTDSLGDYQITYEIVMEYQ